MIEGMLIAFASVGIGWVAGRLQRREAKPKVATCSCTHPRSVHTEGTKDCNEWVKRDKYNVNGGWVGNEYVPCPCQIYDGPEPVAGYYAPEISG